MNTLDQQRAQYAWERAKRNTAAVGGYREMVKGAPALIMGNGLMATLAYYQSRTGLNKEPAQALLLDLLDWLARRHNRPSDFALAMNEFFKDDAQRLMRATDETLAMLRWLRQFADAVECAR